MAKALLSADLCLRVAVGSHVGRCEPLCGGQARRTPSVGAIGHRAECDLVSSNLRRNRSATAAGARHGERTACLLQPWPVALQEVRLPPEKEAKAETKVVDDDLDVAFDEALSKAATQFVSGLFDECDGDAEDGVHEVNDLDETDLDEASSLDELATSDDEVSDFEEEAAQEVASRITRLQPQRLVAAEAHEQVDAAQPTTEPVGSPRRRRHMVIGGVPRRVVASLEVEEANANDTAPLMSPQARNRLVGSAGRRRKAASGTQCSAPDGSGLGFPLPGQEQLQSSQLNSDRSQRRSHRRTLFTEKSDLRPLVLTSSEALRLDADDSGGEEAGSGKRASSITRKYDMLGAEHHWLGNALHSSEHSALATHSTRTIQRRPLSSFKIASYSSKLVSLELGLSQKLGAQPL